MTSKAELIECRDRHEAICMTIDAELKAVTKFKNGIMSHWSDDLPLDDKLKVSQAVINFNNYISQKKDVKVSHEREIKELDKEIEQL